MSAQSPACGNHIQSASPATLGRVASNFASRSSWRLKNEAAPLSAAARSDADQRSACENTMRMRPHEGGIFLLHPDALGTADLEILGRLSQLGVSFPLAASNAESSALPANIETRRALVERLQNIVEMLKSDGGTPRSELPADKTIERKNLRLDFKTCQAFWKNQTVNLTITEFNIVSLFAERHGENLSYREIYDIVHGVGFCAGDGVTGYQTNVRSLIKRIRQKFTTLDEGFNEIENHRGYGYRWRDHGGDSLPAGSATYSEATLAAPVDVDADEVRRALAGNVTSSHLLMVCVVNATPAI